MLTIDEARGVVVIQDAKGGKREHALDTAEAFEAVSAAWLRAGWDVKYVYGFSWMGRPIIQLPEDMIRIQEVIFALKPDVVIETGVAHGGSLIFYSSLFAAMGHGRCVGIDIEIRPHNRKAIEAHPLAKYISLIEGSSTDGKIVAAAREHIKPGEKVLIILDSNHTKDHVAAELAAYAPMVTKGSYIVACDGIMKQVTGAPRTSPDWTWNNPITAVEEFLTKTRDFVLEEPEFPFNEGKVRERVTYWPKSFLKRVS